MNKAWTAWEEKKRLVCANATDRACLSTETHIFEQRSNVGCHQQYPCVLRGCQFPCHGSPAAGGSVSDGGLCRLRGFGTEPGDGPTGKWLKDGESALEAGVLGAAAEAGLEHIFFSSAVVVHLSRSCCFAAREAPFSAADASRATFPRSVPS